MILTDNQQLALAHLKHSVKKMDRTELEERLVSVVQDYFAYQNNVKELAKHESFGFLKKIEK